MTIRIRRQLGNVDNGTDGTAAEFKFHFIAVSTENTDFRERKKKRKKKRGGGGKKGADHRHVLILLFNKITIQFSLDIRLCKLAKL